MFCCINLSKSIWDVIDVDYFLNTNTIKHHHIRKIVNFVLRNLRNTRIFNYSQITFYKVHCSRTYLAQLLTILTLILNFYTITKFRFTKNLRTYYRNTLCQ